MASHLKKRKTKSTQEVPPSEYQISIKKATDVIGRPPLLRRPAMEMTHTLSSFAFSPRKRFLHASLVRTPSLQSRHAGKRSVRTEYASFPFTNFIIHVRLILVPRIFPPIKIKQDLRNRYSFVPTTFYFIHKSV